MPGLIEFSLFSRAYYIVVVPLKKQRTGKFLKPWDNPDEMNMEEVCSKKRHFYIPLSFFLHSKLGRGCNLGQSRAGGAGDEMF